MESSRLFDSAMCCPTGLCGPTVDQSLLHMSETIPEWQAARVRSERSRRAIPGPFSATRTGTRQRMPWTRFR